MASLEFMKLYVTLWTAGLHIYWQKGCFPAILNTYRWVQRSIAFYAEEPLRRYSSDDNTARVHWTDLQQTCSQMFIKMVHKNNLTKSTPNICVI